MYPFRQRWNPVLPMLLFAVSACGDDPTSSEFVPPVMDGVHSPGEWESATQVAAFGGARFLFMNDAENLYMALEVEDPTFDAADRFEIRFDNNGNGQRDDPENNLRIDGAQLFRDAHFGEGSWGIPDSESDGTGAAGGGDGLLFFEISQPLNSGDAEDFALEPGDRLGYCVIFARDGTSSDNSTFPAACQGVGANLGGFAEIVIE